MPIQVKDVSAVLADLGLAHPDLQVLKPNDDKYQALLFQPKGIIVADDNGLRNADRLLAKNQFTAFLTMARDEGVDLAITPEYSTPWEVITQAISSGTVPADGKLWALGCEGITREGLSAFVAGVSEHCVVRHEPLPASSHRFFDPLLYLFRTTTMAEQPESRLVALIQFKTKPMRDPFDWERDRLIEGTLVYRFGTRGETVRLASLICSDSLAVDDETAKELRRDTLLIHVQLNPSPRQGQFGGYRRRVYESAEDGMEILCLNWAENVVMCLNGTTNAWRNISGSAWYTKSPKFDSADVTLTANHRKGMYHTWHSELRCHTLYFAFPSAVFKLEASKVVHIDVPITLSNRRGPQLKEIRQWDTASKSWVVAQSMGDGFQAEAQRLCVHADRLCRLADANPFAAERVMALAAGKCCDQNWYEHKVLDSCLVKGDEVMKRVTVCHDKDEGATEFRTGRFNTMNHVVRRLEGDLPSALADLSDQTGVTFEFDWTRESPHTNIKSPGPMGKRATVIYLGDGYDEAKRQEVHSKIADHLLTTPGKSLDDRVTAVQRLAMWYRELDGTEPRYKPDAFTRFDRSSIESPLNYTRDT